MYNETYVDMWDNLEYDIQGVHPTYYAFTRGNLEQHELKKFRNCNDKSGFNEEENDGTVYRLQRAVHDAGHGVCQPPTALLSITPNQ